MKRLAQEIEKIELTKDTIVEKRFKEDQAPLAERTLMVTMDDEINICEFVGLDVLKSRPYQAQLEEIAMKRNSIIFLPTGSGKTFIAARLITRLKDALRKPWGQGGKRTFFLVNTVVLIAQHKKVITSLCPVKSVGSYSGEDNVDYWNKAQWDAELEKHEVILMTSQILCDMMLHNYIKVSDINLLIFDECHGAVENHPMRRIMKNFEDFPVSEQPRVIGLSATLLNGNVNIMNLEKFLKNLETTFHATIATVNMMNEVKDYSTNPEEQVLFYQKPCMNDASLSALTLLDDLLNVINVMKVPLRYEPLQIEGQKDITTDPRKINKTLKNIVTDMKNNIQNLGVYGGSIGILAYIVLLERFKRKSMKADAVQYKLVITHAIMARRILEDHMKDDIGFKKIANHSSEQILHILKILKEYQPTLIKDDNAFLEINKHRNNLSGIIFTKQRFTAKIIYNILKDVTETNPEEYGFLRHEFIVGFNINPEKDVREQYYNKKISHKAVINFSNKNLNLLISTNVLEEGVDIPQCSLIIRFDPHSDYRSYIQGKGRARSSKSNYIMLVDEADKTKFYKSYITYRNTADRLDEILIGRSDCREMPDDDNLTKFYKEGPIPPYKSPFNEKTLTAVSAPSLLNRYIMSLPHDSFTNIVPSLLLHETGEKKIVSILMPIACPVKDKIVGDPYIALKTAKQSAAMKACIKLYEEGELDAEHMLPIAYGKVDFDEINVQTCFPNWPSSENDSDDIPKAGTKKRVRKHQVKYPSCLRGVKDWHSGKKTFYLHIIKLKTEFPEPLDTRELALYNFLQSEQGYGFMTLQPLPTICEFPMYLTVGECTTSLDVNYSKLELSIDEFNFVKRFHLFIFDDVLEVAKKFCVFNGMCALYAVPVSYSDGAYIVDWAVMSTYKSVRPVAPLSDEERINLDVTRDSYMNTIVTPWYRNVLLPDRYVVSNVLEYVTPLSLFQGNEYDTYEDYYKTRYQLEVMGPKHQPMLEVRNIKTRMNCLLPRAATLDTLTNRERKLACEMQGEDKLNRFKEMFVPEFCIKNEYPGLLWFKSTMLPSMVHRVTMLLKAYEIREKICKDTNVGLASLAPGNKWKSIQIDKNVATKSILAQIEKRQEVTCIDRINNPACADAPRPVNTISMKEGLYELTMKELDKQYSWQKENEPLDIERNLRTATLMDIECYDEFMLATAKEPSPVRGVKSPVKQNSGCPALLPPPLKYNDTINLLSRRATGLGPELCDVLAALTTMKSNDTLNLERAETLGDSFLKFAATLYLFHKFPTLNEGQLSNIKGRLIGNRNLFYAGRNMNLGGIIKAENFSPRDDFIVPGFGVPDDLQEVIMSSKIRPTFLLGLEFPKEDRLAGVLSEATVSKVAQRIQDTQNHESEPIHEIQASMQCYINAQAVSDKTVADCVEAMIGTYLISSGIEGGVKMLEWFRIIPKEDNFMSYLNRPLSTVFTNKSATIDDINYYLNKSVSDIEKIIQYKFKDPALLLEAMSHSSYIQNRLTRSYERLEFLGDAVLDFLVTSYIYENHSRLSPGELTDLRSSLVNNVTFASYVVRLGLHKYLLYQLNPALDSVIVAFVEHQEKRGHIIEEDVIYLIDEEDCQIAEYVEVPKVLSDIFEALAGAIYLDAGGDMSVVWRVFYKIMCREIHMFSENIPRQPVRMLHEQIFACPSFGEAIEVGTVIPKVQVAVTFTKNGCQRNVHGFGSNKFQAKRAAAKLALKLLMSG